MRYPINEDFPNPSKVRSMDRINQAYDSPWMYDQPQVIQDLLEIVVDLDQRLTRLQFEKGKSNITYAETAQIFQWYLEQDVNPLLKAIESGFTYDPGHSDLDDEQPINVRMTLGDYRRALRLKDELDKTRDF